MFSKKGWPVTVIIASAISFLAFKSLAGAGGNINTSKQEQLLTAIGLILEQKHYSPQVIDDSFSAKVFKKYLGDLDPDKDIFLQQDIDTLSKYKFFAR